MLILFLVLELVLDGNTQIVDIPRECVNTLLYIARARERERRAAELRAGEGTGQRDSIADGTALRGELHSLLVFFQKTCISRKFFVPLHPVLII